MIVELTELVRFFEFALQLDSVGIGRGQNSSGMNDCVPPPGEAVYKLAGSGLDFPQAFLLRVWVFMRPGRHNINKDVQPIGSARIILGLKTRFVIDTF